MDSVLDMVVSQDEVTKFEKHYNAAMDNHTMSDQIQFEYACCLVRSETSVDIQKGIVLLNELCNKNTKDRRDYMYFLAIGYARLKNYSKAKEMLDLILRYETTNNQVLQLKKDIQERSKEEMKDMAYNVGAGALIVGGIVGVAMALAKSK